MNDESSPRALPMILEGLGLDREQLEHMADMTRRMAVLIAVMKAGTSDLDALATQIYHDKQEMIDLEVIREAVQDLYPKLVEGGELIEMGVGDLVIVNPELLPIIAQYNATLEADDPPKQ